MARKSVLSDWLKNNSAADFIARWNASGQSRFALWREIGYSNEGAAYNAARNAGIIAGGPVGNGNGDKGTGERKPRGQLPTKIAIAVCKVLGMEPDQYDEIGYDQWCQALNHQSGDSDEAGVAWVNMLLNRVGGKESEAALSFKAWLNWHVKREQAERERAERESDPTFQLKEQLSQARKAAKIAQDRMSELEARVAELETDLRNARLGSRRTNGGTLTSAMKRLMQQRFHPDKQNGNDPDMYTALAAWVNALETVD